MKHPYLFKVVKTGNIWRRKGNRYELIKFGKDNPYNFKLGEISDVVRDNFTGLFGPHVDLSFELYYKQIKNETV